MAKVEFLEIRGCDYADYQQDLQDLVPRWRDVTERQNLHNRKDWEFVTMARFAEKYATPGGRVLDTACGRESLVNWLASRSETVIATDLWESAYLQAAEIELEDFLTFWRTLPNVYPMVADSRTLPFNTDTFDSSFSVSSVEHFLPEVLHVGAAQALSEMIRVTKPGGLIAFSTEMSLDQDDEWWFSPHGLFSFLEQFVDKPSIEGLDCPDGSDEKYGLYPVAIALRKV